MQVHPSKHWITTHGLPINDNIGIAFVVFLKGLGCLVYVHRLLPNSSTLWAPPEPIQLYGSEYYIVTYYSNEGYNVPFCVGGSHG